MNTILIIPSFVNTSYKTNQKELPVKETGWQARKEPMSAGDVSHEKTDETISSTT